MEERQNCIDKLGIFINFDLENKSAFDNYVMSILVNYDNQLKPKLSNKEILEDIANNLESTLVSTYNIQDIDYLAYKYATKEYINEGSTRGKKAFGKKLSQLVHLTLLYKENYVGNIKHIAQWIYYVTDDSTLLAEDKSGKWMYFFDNQEFAKQMCQKAIDEKICYECKCTNLEITREPIGVLCFYLNGDDIENHKRVIQFMLDNDLIRVTKDGKLYNISFKFNNQTRAGEYGANFEGKIKLEQFLNLYTREWLV